MFMISSTCDVIEIAGFSTSYVHIYSSVHHQVFATGTKTWGGCIYVHVVHAGGKWGTIFGPHMDR